MPLRIREPAQRGRKHDAGIGGVEVIALRDQQIAEQ